MLPACGARSQLFSTCRIRTCVPHEWGRLMPKARPSTHGPSRARQNNEAPAEGTFRSRSTPARAGNRSQQSSGDQAHPQQRRGRPTDKSHRSPSAASRQHESGGAQQHARASLHRLRNPPPALAEPRCRPSPPRALTVEERAIVLGHLHAERFQDRSPAEVYGTLLDEGVYCCSIRTLYRLLAAEGESRERRDQLIHPPYQKPQLLATAPNQLWSWDITKLLGPAKWTYFYLYVILDVFSRYVVGWMVAHREGKELARQFIAENLCKAPDRPRPAHPP